MLRYSLAFDYKSQAIRRPQIKVKESEMEKV